MCYDVYVLRVLNHIHPDMTISCRAVKILGNFQDDLFQWIAAESSRLAHYNRRSTITSRESQTALILLKTWRYICRLVTYLLTYLLTYCRSSAASWRSGQDGCRLRHESIGLQTIAHKQQPALFRATHIFTRKATCMHATFERCKDLEQN